jgi:type I restriction enzyme R subunit
MIGRGTRLCKDIFGPGEDKQGFLIFDYHDNFRYFRTRHTWSTVDQDTNGKSFTMTPQSILINTRKLGILRTLIESDNLSPFDEQYKNRLKSYFIDSVRGLCNDDIEVQYNMSYVSKYRTAEQWDGFTNSKIDEIVEHILPLLPPESDPMKVKTFDLMIYVIEDEVL